MIARELLEPLLVRDDEGIASSVSAQISEAGFPSALAQVAQFAILAYAPDQRARAALLSLEALGVIADRLPAELRSLQLIEMARMSADARRPWSEAPITTAPVTTTADARDDALQRAVIQRDRLAVERWIAHNCTSETFAGRFFRCAARITDEEASPLRIAACAWRLADAVPDPYRFGVLRLAAVEWTAGHQWLDDQGFGADAKPAHDASSIAGELISRYVDSEEPLLSFVAVEAFDASQFAFAMASRTTPSGLSSRATIASVQRPGTRFLSDLRHSPLDDYGTAVRALGIAQRRSTEWNRESLDAMCAAALRAPRVK